MRVAAGHARSFCKNCEKMCVRRAPRTMNLRETARGPARVTLDMVTALSRGVMIALVVAACGHPPQAASVVAPAPKLVLAVLPAESDQFPHAAKAATESMSRAKVGGIDETSVSKVSLEVVQLSIECTDATPACYAAIGHSLSANRLLFTEISAGAKPGEIKISVTLFDVDANAAKHTAEKVFAREADATAGAEQLVAEATRS